MIDILRCLKCKAPLTDSGETLTCECGATYPRVDGVVVLNKGSNYYGEVKAEAKEEVVSRLEAGEHWRDVVWDMFRHSYEFLHHIITDETRNDFSTLLPISKDATVLDLGAGWGTTSCHFAQRARRVISLDGTFDRTLFIQNRITQDKVDNIHTVCTNILDKPFMENSFDVVLLNGVLEWVGTSLADLDPREAQLATLKEVRRILKPEGALYIGIENSHGYRYIMGGMDDHTALFHIGYHTREKANEVRFKHQNKRYDTYTYDMSGYGKLLEEAGFSCKDFYYPYPDYKWVNALFPLDDGPALDYYYKNLHENQDADSEVERTRSLELHASEHGHVKHHVASYSVVASSGAVDGYVPSLKNYMADNSTKLLDAKTKVKDLTFLQLSGQTGKKFSKGRLKHMVFSKDTTPKWLAISTRDPKEELALEQEHAVLELEKIQQCTSFNVSPSFIEKDIFNRTVLFQKMLPGQTISQEMASLRYRMGFEPETIYSLIGENLDTASSILKEMQKSVDTQTTSMEDQTDQRLESVRAFCTEHGFSMDGVDCVTDYLAPTATLSHGDFVPWNVLKNGDAPAGLIDWELAYAGRLGVMDWLRFAWGTAYDVARLKTDELTFEDTLKATMFTGKHPASEAFDSYLSQGIGCKVGSTELKALMQFFFINEAMLQVEHSLTPAKALIENAHKKCNEFNQAG